MAAYAMVHLAAVARVLIPLIAPVWYGAAVLASTALWCAAFIAFTMTYWLILSRPRLVGAPG